MMRKLIVPALGAAIAASAAVAWTWPKPDSSRPVALAAAFEPPENYEFEPPEPGTYQLNIINSAPDGVVLDTNGESHDLRHLLAGKYTLVSFVYLTCGDVNGCPLAISTLFDIYETSEQLPGLGDDVQLMTISFDPERDTVEAINSFAYPIHQDSNASQKLGWQVLTTQSQEDIQPILDGFGQAINKSPDEDIINHLLRMYLVDRDGNIRNVYGLGFLDPRLLMGDVETLLMAEQRS